MNFIAHRVNTAAALSLLPRDVGAEIDVRADGSRLYLNHDPFRSGESLADFLARYAHGTLVLNIKEAGIEDETLRLVRERGVTSFFLLDVEFPYLYLAARRGERAIAVRYSEDEPIGLAERYAKLVDWVWVDTMTRLPLDAESVSTLKSYKSCLVCPSRWGRPNDITGYCASMNGLGFAPDAVMTSPELIAAWKSAMAMKKS